jgi:ABC-type transporter Mla subunit MlaD
LACGISVGTPVRVRGVQVGTVLAVTPSLERVDVVAEIADAALTVVPRNSVVEANQSGLIAEPLVDITPQLPVPQFEAGPLDGDACEAEKAIVCDGGRLRGQQGVALDDLVYVMTKMARQMDGDGLDKVFLAAEAATAAVEEATPLLAQAALLAEQATPLLKELREGGMLSSAAHLTEAAAAAAEDVNELQRQVMTPENVRAARGAVLALCKTLQHVEGISADVGGLARDGGVQRGVKTLVQALARVVEE